MSIPTMMSRSTRAFTIVACLALVGACEKEEKDSDSAATDGGGTAESSATNATNATEGGSDPTEGSSASSPATGDTSDTSGQVCEGDWSLGSVPFSGDPTLGQACDDPVVPKNCADGTYIKFADTNECICIALCSSLGVSAGQNCTDDGKWVCANIEATNAGRWQRELPAAGPRRLFAFPAQSNFSGDCADFDAAISPGAVEVVATAQAATASSADEGQWGAALQAMGPEELMTLRAAAVLGARFDAGVVATLLEAEAGAAALVAAGVVAAGVVAVCLAAGASEATADALRHDVGEDAFIRVEDADEALATLRARGLLG